MLFRRRTREGLLQRFRVSLWPRRSLGRSAQYFWKRILRLSASPHAIAAGVAAGAFAAFLPFLGLHILIAAGLAWVLRGNVLAAALGTAAVGNPLSYPLIWAATYAGGRFLLHSGARVLRRDAYRQPTAPHGLCGFVAPGAGADDRRRRTVGHRRRCVALFPNSRRRIGLPQRQVGTSGPPPGDGRGPETPPVSQT